MFVVIFKAEINELDALYFETAKQLHDLAINEYGCTHFTSVTEATNEISISHWNNLDDIKHWKNNTQHLVAQNIGRKKWYKNYNVQILELIREYQY